MFRRKLLALDYSSPDNFNVCSVTDFRKLVIWLEDQKIRYYKIEERTVLRNDVDPKWEEAFQIYLGNLSCPVEKNDRKAVTDWLLALAVRLDYGDNVEKFKNITAENTKKNLKNVPQVVQANPLDNMDFESTDFKAGVASLAQLLKVVPHPDHLVTLRAISALVKKNFSQDALENAKNKIKTDGKPFPLKESPLGFETNDYVLNMAAKIMRLLYIHDLRDLQTRINETIVAIQNTTANPKTDTRLGKVGR